MCYNKGFSLRLHIIILKNLRITDTYLSKYLKLTTFKFVSKTLLIFVTGLFFLSSTFGFTGKQNSNVEASSIVFAKQQPLTQEKISVTQQAKVIKEIAVSEKKTSNIVPKRIFNYGNANSEALRNFLRAQGSYLADYTDLIISESAKYGVNYKLLIAIAGVESSYCRVNFRPYNCWGFGRYSWTSPQEAIIGWLALMNTGYFSKGKTTPETIASPYNPNPARYIQKVYQQWNKIP